MDDRSPAEYNSSAPFNAPETPTEIRDVFEICPLCGTGIRLGYAVCPGCGAKRETAGSLSGFPPVIRTLMIIVFMLALLALFASLILGWFAAGFLSLGVMAALFFRVCKQERIERWTRTK